MKVEPDDYIPNDLIRDGLETWMPQDGSTPSTFVGLDRSEEPVRLSENYRIPKPTFLRRLQMAWRAFRWEP